MKQFSLILIICISLSACLGNAQQPDNTKPMYGEVPKSAEYKKADEQFIQNALQECGSRDSAVNFYLDRAWRYFYNNDLPAAIKRFNQAWLLNPDAPDPYFGFAALTGIKGDSAAAARLYQTAMDKDKTGRRAPICYQHIAYCKEQLGDDKGALAAYRHITALEPTNSFAWQKTGYFHLNAGDTAAALLAYDSALVHDPQSSTTYNNKAYIYQLQHQYAAAIAGYSKAITLDATNINAYVNRGTTAMEQQDYKAAKKDFETAVQLQPADGALRRMLGIARQHLNDHAGACKDFNQAAQLGDILAAQLTKESCK